MKILLAAILILGQAWVLTAQTKKFRWMDFTCEYESTYDAKKYTEAQLKGTVELFSAVGYIPLETKTTVWKYEEIKDLDVAALDREYASKRAALEKLDIVKSPFWENLRARRLSELKQFYELSRLTLLGYDEPATLRKAVFAEACVEKYGEPLISGGDRLLAIWREMNEESRDKNVDPERVRKIFEAEYQSPDRLKFARVKVMAFGFWNCANALLENVERDGTHEKEFKKLFKQTKEIYCDEP